MANSVVALKLLQKIRLGFQVVHHDLWITMSLRSRLSSLGKTTRRHRITTKMGRVFVLNRLTGAPLIPVEENRSKPDIPGEESWPTQPSAFPPSGRSNAEDAFGFTSEIKMVRR